MAFRFRFDDISINTDAEKLYELVEIVSQFAPDVQIILAISPIVFSQEQLPGFGNYERVHPPRLTAMSALAPYYRGESCGIPQDIRSNYEGDDRIRFAGHGIAHVDHRLLSADAQELSILMSCALAGDSIFVPPYNHWNQYTEYICKQNEIELIKFEDGWQHCLHHFWTRIYERWYLHPYDLTPEKLTEWFEKGSR